MEPARLSVEELRKQLSDPYLGLAGEFRGILHYVKPKEAYAIGKSLSAHGRGKKRRVAAEAQAKPYSQSRKASGFFCYSKALGDEMRQKCIQQGVKALKQTDAVKEASASWKKLSAEEKKEWTRRAELERAKRQTQKDVSAPADGLSSLQANYGSD